MAETHMICSIDHRRYAIPTRQIERVQPFDEKTEPVIGVKTAAPALLIKAAQGDYFQAVDDLHDILTVEPDMIFPLPRLIRILSTNESVTHMILDRDRSYLVIDLSRAIKEKHA